MTGIACLREHVAFPPYVIDVYYGVEAPNNEISLEATVVWDKGEVKPRRTFTYLEINSTAGVINHATSTYVKQIVIEADMGILGTEGKDPYHLFKNPGSRRRCTLPRMSWAA
ncbi:hypothetical protein QBC40DRAFT_293755 [Triangularia verruculosa]|uniref:Uncharacterized protein n=1 Tax=Triangularia verruculosa TaxID=2587418 RepID=A0AAN6XMW4_9PEZI|nr:hypothetical protein QBC40DRAFT_293755 [Triangularia verruculosa]